jgi:glycine cleavage system H protein
LEDSPELVNSDPYNDGWMIEVQPESSQELEELLEKKAYLDMLKGME